MHVDDGVYRDIVYIYISPKKNKKKWEILCCSVNWTRKKIKELVFQSIISHSLSSLAHNRRPSSVLVEKKFSQFFSLLFSWSSPDPIIIRFCEISTITNRQCQRLADALTNALVTYFYGTLQTSGPKILHSFSRNSQTPNTQGAEKDEAKLQKHQKKNAPRHAKTAQLSRYLDSFHTIHTLQASFSLLSADFDDFSPLKFTKFALVDFPSRLLHCVTYIWELLLYMCRCWRIEWVWITSLRSTVWKYETLRRLWLKNRIGKARTHFTQFTKHFYID